MAALLAACLMMGISAPAVSADSGFTKREIEAIVTSVANSEDRDATYLALTPAERDAYNRYMTEGTLEVSDGRVEKLPPSSPSEVGTYADDDGGGGGGGSTCWGITKTVTWKNNIGTILWRWKHHGEWCGNGSKITKTIVRSWWPVVYAEYWKVNANFHNWKSGGVNFSYWRSFAQAEFSFCPPLAGCTTWKYPWIDMTMRPNGTVDGALGS